MLSKHDVTVLKNALIETGINSGIVGLEVSESTVNLHKSLYTEFLDYDKVSVLYFHVNTLVLALLLNCDGIWDVMTTENTTHTLDFEVPF